MSATELRTDLLQQIEQADEKLLRIVSSVLKAVKTEYVAEEEEELTDEAFAKLPVPPFKKRSREELMEELKEADAACDRGEFVTLEELDKEMASW